MTVLDAIPTALGVAEDAILAALRTLGPAEWDTKLHETVASLTLPQTGASRVTRVFIAQHQDNGGRGRPYFGARFWEGIVTVKCFARPGDDAGARAGMALANTALLAATAPTGYAITIRVAGAAPLSRENVAARGLRYSVEVRRTA